LLSSFYFIGKFIINQQELEIGSFND